MYNVYMHNVLLLMLMLIHHSPYKYQLCLHDQTRWSEIVKIIRKIHGFCLHSFYYVATFIAFYLFFHSLSSISLPHFVCWFFSLIFHLPLVSLSAHILDFIGAGGSDPIHSRFKTPFSQFKMWAEMKRMRKKNAASCSTSPTNDTFVDASDVDRCVWEEALKLICKSFRFIDCGHSTIIIKCFQQTYAFTWYPFVIWYLTSRFTSIKHKNRTDIIASLHHQG